MSDMTPTEPSESASPEPATEPAAPTGAPAEPAAAPAAPAAPPAATSAGATSPTRPNRRKVREGLVSSAVQDKTVVVNVIERVRHPRYAKTVQRTKHFYAHDEQNEVRVGDRVRIQETRPMSKLKRWRVVEVLERAR